MNERFYKRSYYAKNYSEVLVSDKMGGKMEYIPSISTSCLVNPRCLARLNSDNPDCICTSCFAADGLAYKNGLRENCIHNYELLNSKVLSLDELPEFIKGVVPLGVRIESFGDVGSVTQCYNYINICNLNPDIVFAAWTKNIDYWDEAINDIGKPANLIMVESGALLNHKISPSKWWVDKTFTVWTLDYLLEHHIDVDKFINCGGKRCVDCKKCYTLDDDTKNVYELIKKDQSRWTKIKEVNK